MNIVSDSVKSATITIDIYTLKGSREDTSLANKASSISKKKLRHLRLLKRRWQQMQGL
jgi:hypothetical protein